MESVRIERGSLRKGFKGRCIVWGLLGTPPLPESTCSLPGKRQRAQDIDAGHRFVKCLSESRADAKSHFGRRSNVLGWCPTSPRSLRRLPWKLGWCVAAEEIL